jgi:hypothetical protein
LSSSSRTFWRIHTKPKDLPSIEDKNQEETMKAGMSKRQSDAVYREVIRTAAVQASINSISPSGKFLLKTLIKQFSRMFKKGGAH